MSKRMSLRDLLEVVSEMADDPDNAGTDPCRTEGCQGLAVRSRDAWPYCGRCASDRAHEVKQEPKRKGGRKR